MKTEKLVKHAGVESINRVMHDTEIKDKDDEDYLRNVKIQDINDVSTFGNKKKRNQSGDSDIEGYPVDPSKSMKGYNKVLANVNKRLQAMEIAATVNKGRPFRGAALKERNPPPPSTSTRNKSRTSTIFVGVADPSITRAEAARRP